MFSWWITYIKFNTNLFSQGSTLPIAHALSFSGKIDPTFPLNTGDKIYRIIEKNKNKKGNWWLENKPISKTTWRSDSAVSEQWNKGTDCVEVTLNKKLIVWRGIAASQAVPMSPSKCYLKGGEYQLWLDPNELQVSTGNESVYNWP